jgi:hypothetical protein
VVAVADEDGVADRPDDVGVALRPDLDAKGFDSVREPPRDEPAALGPAAVDGEHVVAVEGEAVVGALRLPEFGAGPRVERGKAAVGGDDDAVAGRQASRAGVGVELGIPKQAFVRVAPPARDVVSGGAVLEENVARAGVQLVFVRGGPALRHVVVADEGARVGVVLDVVEHDRHDLGRRLAARPGGRRDVPAAASACGEGEEQMPAAHVVRHTCARGGNSPAGAIARGAEKNRRAGRGARRFALREVRGALGGGFGAPTARRPRAPAPP